jgi:hypothetical protein
MVSLSRSSPQGAAEEIKQAFAMLQGLLKGVVQEAALKQVKSIALESLKHYTGEAAGAFWVTGNGRLGAASIARVKNGTEARAALLRLFRVLGRELDRLLTKGLSPEILRELKGFRVSLRVRENGLRVAGLRGDRVDLNIRWPRLKEPKERKKLRELKKALAAVLGPRISIGMLTTGEVLIVGIGKDLAGRMARVVSVAKGGQGSSMEQTVRTVAGGERLVALVYIPAAALAEQVMRLVERVVPVPAKVKGVFRKMMPKAGEAAPVSLKIRSDDTRLSLNLSVSTEVVGMISRAVAASMLPQGATRAP